MLKNLYNLTNIHFGGSTQLTARDRRRVEKFTERDLALAKKLYNQVIINVNKQTTPSFSTTSKLLNKAYKDFKQGKITRGVYHALLSIINVFSLLPAKDIPGIVNMGVPMPKLVAEINQQAPFIVQPIAPGGRGFGPLSNPEDLLNWHMIPKKKVLFKDKEIKRMRKRIKGTKADPEKLRKLKRKYAENAPKQSQLYKKTHRISKKINEIPALIQQGGLLDLYLHYL